MANPLYSAVVNEIEGKIKAGIFQDNERLPSERVMAESFGVSRTVIREALKILQEKRLVKMIAGSGNFITIPKEEDLIDQFEIVIDNSSITQEDIIEAREIIENAISHRVISRVTAEDIAALKEIYEKMVIHFGNSEIYAKLDAKFHLMLASCTRNNALKMITATLNNVTDRTVISNNIDMRMKSHKEHLAIISAIEERDNVKLETAMMQHLSCFSDNMRKK